MEMVQAHHDGDKVNTLGRDFGLVVNTTHNSGNDKLNAMGYRRCEETVQEYCLQGHRRKS